MPTKSAKSAAPSKPTRSPARKPAAARRRSVKTSQLEHGQIAERAYFIHLEEGGSDELANWLRAERELTTV